MFVPFQSDSAPVHIMQASMIIFSLMPMLPVQFGTSALADTFDAFSVLAAQCTKRPSKPIVYSFNLILH